MLNSDICWTTCEMDVTCGLLCWITTILACLLVGLKSLMISLDYQSYMGSSVRIWSLRWLFLYLCSYNLDGSMTLSRTFGTVQNNIGMFHLKLLINLISLSVIGSNWLARLGHDHPVRCPPKSRESSGSAPCGFSWLASCASGESLFAINTQFTYS
jgi:hypothetical protein